METVTPLMKRLGRCTGLAEVALCAGVLLWGSWRLKAMTGVDHNLELAEAAFAYTVDWRYLDVEAGPKGRAPDQPPELSATIKLNKFMRQAAVPRVRHLRGRRRLRTPDAMKAPGFTGTPYRL